MLDIKVKDADLSCKVRSNGEKKKAMLPDKMTFDDPSVFYSTYWLFCVPQDKFDSRQNYYCSDRMHVAYVQTFVVGQKKTSKEWFDEVENDSQAHRELQDARALVLCSQVTKPYMYSELMSPGTNLSQFVRYFGFHCAVPVTEETAKDYVIKTITIEDQDMWIDVETRTLLKSCLPGTIKHNKEDKNYYLGAYKCSEHTSLFYPTWKSVQKASGEMKIVEALEGYRKTYSDYSEQQLSKTHFLLYARSLQLFDLTTILDEDWNRILDYLLRYNLSEDHYGNLRGIWYIADPVSGNEKRVTRERWRQETGATKRIKLE